MTLREISPVQQSPGTGLRRWFTSSEMDLFVWVDGGGSLLGFQFSYDKQHGERALAWNAQGGFSHDRVDDGEGEPGAKHKGTPVMRDGGRADVGRIAGLLTDSGAALPADLLKALVARIRQYQTAA